MAISYAECIKHGATPDLVSTESLLTTLLQAETVDRGLRSIRHQMHAARFPIHRDLAGFDFEQSKVDRLQILGFATTTFTEKAENIVLIGGTGTGKTHLATALDVEVFNSHGKHVRFFSTVYLVNALEQEKANGTPAGWPTSSCTSIW